MRASPHYCRIARTQQDVDDAQHLRFRCIATDLEIAVELDPSVERDISSRDCLPTTHHLLLYSGQALIGTARLALPNPEVAVASRTELGLELEQEFDLAGVSEVHEGLAEVARLCVHKPWRATAAVHRLYEGLYCLSRELGVKSWIGAVDSQSCRADEADLMLAVLERRGLFDERLRVRGQSRRQSEADALGKSFYSDGERAIADDRLSELRIASTLTSFTRRLGARCVGRPARHPAFPRFVLPMLVDLDRLPQSTLKKFDLSQMAPSFPERRHDAPKADGSEERRMAS